MKNSSRSRRGKSDTRDGERVPRPFGAERRQANVEQPQQLYVALSYNSAVAAGMGNTLAVQALSSSVQSAPATEWGVMAAVWGQYRVVSMTLIVQPYFNVVDSKDLLAGGTSGYPGPMISCQFGAQHVSGGWVNIQDNPGFRFHPVGKAFVVKASAKAVNPFALEWTDTGSAIPAAQTFGVVADSAVAAPAAFNAIPVCYTTVYWDVEFRGRR